MNADFFDKSKSWCAGFVLLCAAALTLLTACGGGQVAEREPNAPYGVVATTGMVGDLVKAVAGDRADVVVLIGEGVDPHLYNPTRSDVARLGQADIIFYNGHLLEGKMAQILERMRASGRPVHAVAESLEVALLSYEDDPGRHDPHVWMDVALWRQALQRVVEKLASFDPAQEDAYREAAAAYEKELVALDQYVRDVTGTIPVSRRILITAHDAFRYFGEAYGLDVIGIQGLSTESEAGLHQINRLVNLIVERQVSAIFVESSVSEKNVRALVEGARAQGHTVAIGGTLFSDAMGAPGTYEGTYLGMIDHNATTVARALGGQPPDEGWRGIRSLEAEDSDER